MPEENIKKSVITGTFWTLLEQLGSKIVALVVEIVLARILMPEDYGIVALAAVFITIANTITIDGLSMSLIQKEDANNQDFSTCFYLVLVTSLFFFGLIYLVAPLVASFYDAEELTLVLRLLGLSCPISSINSIQRAYATRYMLFKKFFVSSTAGYVLAGVFAVFAALEGLGVYALVVETLLKAFFDTLILWFTVRWRPSLSFSIERLKQIWNFGSKILASNLIYQICFQLKSVLIGKFYSSSDLAFYNRGELIPSLISVTADKAIQTALFPAMSKNQAKREVVAGMLRRYIEVGSYLIFPAMTLLGVVATPLVEVVFTHKWTSAVPYIWIFCLCYSLQVLQSANLLALRAVGKSGTTLVQDCIKRVIDLAILFLTLPFGPLAIAFSCVLSSLIAVVINAAPCEINFGYSFFEQIKSVFPTFFNCLVAALAAISLSFFSFSDVWLLICQCLIFIIMYIVVSYIRKDKNFKFICSAIREILNRK